MQSDRPDSESESLEVESVVLDLFLDRPTPRRLNGVVSSFSFPCLFIKCSRAKSMISYRSCSYQDRWFVLIEVGPPSHQAQDLA